MEHVLLIGSTYYFSRRVPREYKRFDKREYVRFSLRTDSKKKAAKLASIENIKLDSYWATLENTCTAESFEYHQQIVDRSRLLGFVYISTPELAKGPYNDLKDRLLFVDQKQLDEKTVEAVIGSANEPVIHLSDLWSIYAKISKDVKLNKTDQQYRKWKVPREKAMNNLIELVGNKPAKEFTRQDMLAVRDWWIDRIDAETARPNTANKQMANIKAIISSINDNYKLDLDKNHLFQDLCLAEDFEPRKPFTTDYILNVLLNPKNLAGMSKVNQALLHVLAETGIGITEQISIRPEDIHLNDTIPFVEIQPYQKNKLKNKFRKRVVPLVGFALDAFKEYPQGFSSLVKSADSTSSAISKYLQDNKLLPTPKHSPYSLRHSFQDRLTNEECPDRIQVDLMGHKFKDRVRYGEGGSLEKKYEYMLKIRLKQ